jgi:uncharacterized protein with PIN domain
MTPPDADRVAHRAWVRCYAELNDFLPRDQRFAEIPIDFDVAPSVKDVIERVGVPHPEVDLVVVDGESVDFGYHVRDGDRISVYPRFEAIDIAPIVKVRPAPLRVTRFLLDGHLGRLARYLRLAGFDTVYVAHRADAALARASSDENRILLTRDRGLLKRREILHGYLVRAHDPQTQFVEVLRRFDLGDRLAPFTRCLACNGRLHDATDAEVGERVPVPVRRRYCRFRACADCGRVYWEGTHYARLTRLVEDAARRATERNPT